MHWYILPTLLQKVLHLLEQNPPQNKKYTSTIHYTGAHNVFGDPISIQVQIEISTIQVEIQQSIQSRNSKMKNLMFTHWFY